MGADRDTAPGRLLIRRGAAFLIAGGLIAYMALDGAAFDVVVRQRIALAVWGFIAFGFAFGILPRAEVDRLTLVPAVGLAGLVAWMALSLTWTESAEQTVEELARVGCYAGLVVLALSALNRFTFRAAASGVSAAVLGIAAVAVATRLFPSTFPDANDVAESFRTDRLDYPLDYWNAIGAWGAMACAIGVAWSAHARHAVTRIISLAAVPVAGLAVYLSYSRGGVLGAAVATVAVIALSRNRWTAFVHTLAVGAGTGAAILVVRSHDQIANATGGEGGMEVVAVLGGAALLCAGAVFVTSIMRADEARLPHHTARWAVPAFVLTLVAAAAVAGGAGLASEAWDEFRNDDTAVSSSSDDPAQRLTSAGGNRNDIWSSAVDAFEANPVQGIGPGTFEFWWQREGGDAEYLQDAHSLPLEFAAELGLPGIALLAVFLGGLFFLALKARPHLDGGGDIGASVAMSAAFVVFVANSSVDWMWEETAVGAVAIGGIAIAAAGGSERLRRHRRRSRLGPVWVRPAIAVAAVAAAAIQVPGIVSNQHLRQSEAKLAEGDAARARDLAQSAIDWQPWAASPHAQLAVVERDTGNLSKAEEEIGLAIDKEDTNWRWPLILAPIQAQAGDRAKAIETFRQGRTLAPKLVFYEPFLPGYGPLVYSPEQLQAIYERQQAKAFAREQAEAAEE